MKIKRLFRKKLPIFVLFFLASVSILILSVFFHSSQSPTQETVFVSRVIDGDTIVLADNRHVRYLSINSPENGECFFQEATMANAGLVFGKTVRLEKDISDKDKYNRLLRYVFVQNGGEEVLVNDILLKNGSAKLLLISPDLHFAEKLKVSAEGAKHNRLGLWSRCPN